MPLRAEIIEQVLVKVNGDIITQSEFEKRQLTALQERPDLAKLTPSSPQFAQAVAEAAPRLISRPSTIFSGCSEPRTAAWR